MAHIVFVINDLVSVRNSVLELSKRLRNAGHQITIGSPRQQVHVFEAYGLDYIQLPPVGTLSEDRTTWQKWREFFVRRDEAVEALNIDSGIEAIDDLDADLIVVEAELPNYLMPLTKLNKPIAIICVFPSIFKRRGIPPLNYYIVPDEGWSGTWWGIEFNWLRYRLRKLRGEIRYFLINGGIYRLSVLRHQAKTIGFNFRRYASSMHWMVPIVFHHIPILYLHAREFDFPHNPPAYVRHLGALLNLDRVDANPNQDEEVRLDNVIEKMSTTPDKKLIYCVFGSVFKGDDSPFIKRLIEAVADQDDWVVILSMGRRREEDIGDMPSNVHAFNWVNQLKVLAVADAIVTHAGIATVMEAVHFGVPIVSYPFDVNDQFGTATRVHYHKLGVVGKRETDTPADMRRHIQTVLTSEAIATQLQTMQKVIHENYPEEDTIALFEQLMEHDSLN